MDWTPANYARLKELRASGLTMRAIAKEFGVNKSVIWRKLNRPAEPRAAPVAVKPAKVSELSKPALRAMLAEAVRNTARL
jgi:transcriptional regulator with XRE-family HTH domain